MADKEISDCGIVLGKMFELFPSKLVTYLEFQYTADRNKNPGLEIDFLTEILEIAREAGTGLLSKTRVNLIESWVDEKMNELKPTTKPNQAGDITVNGKPDKRFKHPQQMLLLERLGIITYLDKYNLTKEKKAVLISNIIGKDAQNTREFLGTMVQPNHKNTCNTQKNNDLIDQLFIELGIPKTV